jgi:hypothetical protein
MIVSEERFDVLCFTMRRLLNLPDDLSGLAKAWQFAGAGPVERWVMAVWTSGSWIAKSTMCFVLGHRMQVQPYPMTDEEEEPYCARCGWSANLREENKPEEETL